MIIKPVLATEGCNPEGITNTFLESDYYSLRLLESVSNHLVLNPFLRKSFQKWVNAVGVNVSEANYPIPFESCLQVLEGVGGRYAHGYAVFFLWDLSWT